MFKRKSNGFTILELLIVVVIIGILSIVAIPTYFTYTNRLYFAEVVQATGPYKLAVENCYQAQGSGASVTACGNGEHGVPPASGAMGNVASVTVSAEGVITATGQGKAPADTIILTPKPSNNVLVWDMSGTCVVNGVC